MLSALTLDAAIQKERFHVQQLEVAQQKKPEGGIAQNAGSEGPKGV